VHLKKAQKQLKEAHCEAVQLQKKHLKEILNQAKAANQTKKSKAVTYLIRAKCNCQCYACYCHHTKLKALGGIVFVNAPDPDGQMQPILDKNKMEDMLLKFSRTHFAKTEGTMFTTKPLGCLLAYDSLPTYGQKISQGCPEFDHHCFDMPTQAILENLKQKIPPSQTTLHALNYEDLMDGIKKWLERTTMSLLGCHLGIYKIL